MREVRLSSGETSIPWSVRSVACGPDSRLRIRHINTSGIECLTLSATGVPSVDECNGLFAATVTITVSVPNEKDIIWHSREDCVGETKRQTYDPRS